MARLKWLADELRRAGLRIVEVSGWKTRGSDTFDPVGITWHATAGSTTATAQGEVNVILNGSETAPPPIAQLMIWRDGTIYICASGRCNHNKVGWDGPNKGLGNTALLGIEMANNNKGEPWPAVQLDAARRATAAIMARLDADPLKRLAAHYEHQPYDTRPPGETSTKSDPYGVRMSDERPLVAAIMRGETIVAFADEKIPLNPTVGVELFEPDRAGGTPIEAHTILQLTAIWAGRAGRGVGTLSGKLDQVLAKLDQLAVQDDTDEEAIITGVLAGLSPATIADAVIEAMPADQAQQVVDELAARLGAAPPAAQG